MSFGDLNWAPSQKSWVCPGCEKEIKGTRITTRWYSKAQRRDVQICQACTSLLFRMSRLYRIFGPVIEETIPFTSGFPSRNETEGEK